jgi:hypothetical protein
LPLLEFNGKKEQIIDDIKLPAILGKNKDKVKQFYPPLSREVAHACGIYDDSDWFSSDRRDNNYWSYVQAPLAPLCQVRDIIQSLLPSNRASQATQRELCTPTFDSGNQSVFEEKQDSPYHLTTPKRPPPRLPEPSAPNRQLCFNVSYCIGIHNDELEKFASSSYANRGYCASIYSYDAQSKCWKSPRCTLTVYNDQEQQQCEPCSLASRNVLLSLLQTIYNGNWEYDSLVLNTEQLHAIIKGQFQILFCVDSLFVNCRIVQRAMTVLRDVHRQYKQVQLLDDSTKFARHCFERGPTCLSVEVVSSKASSNDVLRGTCIACCASRKRKIDQVVDEDVDLHSHHNFNKMSKNQLVTLLRATKKKLRYVSWRLNRARELLIKDRDRAY